LTGLVDAVSPPLLGVTAGTPPGSPGDVVVSFGATSGPTDEPTVTITFFTGIAHDFDFDTAQTEVSGAGFLTQDLVLRSDVDADRFAVRPTFNFDGERAFYSTIINYAEFVDADTFLIGATVVGANNVTMPTTGAASFDTGVYGVFGATPADAGIFFGRGDVSVDFGTGAVTGGIPDVTFLDENLVESDTTAGGLDFGLSINATVSGDSFGGPIMTTGGLVTLNGTVAGDFFGPTNAAPREIGGAFVLVGPDGLAMGALQGILE
jgi:hypothetical protein